MDRIEGEIIALTDNEARLFKAPSHAPMIGEVAAGSVMDELAARQRHLLALQCAPSMTSWTLWFETRAFERKLETFMPVAAAILEHEATQFVNRKTDSGV